MFVPPRRLVIGFVIIILFTTGLVLTVQEQVAQVWPVFFNQERLVPIYGVETDQKKIAISFDAAWGAEYTPKILEILEQHNVKTTFFLVKFWVEKYPEVTKTIVAAGHELGNHSATHPHMNALTPEEMQKELEETNRLIERLTGTRPRLFRPPFGEYNNTLIQVVEDLDMKTIQWSIDSLDWREISSEEIAGRVLEQVEPGAIVLFHNNAQNTPGALEIILEQVRADGYKVVPISQLIYWDNYYIDPHSGLQRTLATARE